MFNVSFWNSTIFWGIAGIIGGFIVSAFFFYVGKEKKSLVYQISTSNLITDEINSTPGLKISVGDEPAVNVISTTITFVNRGNRTITSSDFASLSPLQIISSEHFFNAEHIDVGYIKTRNKAINPRIDVIEKNKIIIEFEYLKPKQEFEITVLHDGELSVGGDLKNGGIQNYSSALKTSEYKHILEKTFTIATPLIMGAIAAFIIGISRDSSNTTDFNNNNEQIDYIQREISDLKTIIIDMERENQQLRDIIGSLNIDESVSGNIDGHIPESD